MQSVYYGDQMNNYYQLECAHEPRWTADIDPSAIAANYHEPPAYLNYYHNFEAHPSLDNAQFTAYYPNFQPNLVYDHNIDFPKWVGVCEYEF